jgi:hypothetical protein
MTHFPLISARPVAIAAASAILMCMAAPAYGQPLFGRLDSIEWMAADSSLIVRGTIETLSTEKDPDGSLWHTVRFRVQETLKGDRQPSVQFLMRSNDIPREVELIDEWKSREEPLLVFLSKSKCLVARGNRRHARYDFAPRTGFRDQSLVALKSENENPVLTMAQQALSREDIVEATKAAIAFPGDGATLCSHSFLLPADLVRDTYWVQTGGGVKLSVPIDSRLEAQARRWIKSTDGSLRVTGTEALIYFRSEANAATLKTLLDDPYRKEVKRFQDRGVKRERVYQVREAAFTVLEAWGVEVPDVVIRESLPQTSTP